MTLSIWSSKRGSERVLRAAQTAKRNGHYVCPIEAILIEFAKEMGLTNRVIILRSSTPSEKSTVPNHRPKMPDVERRQLNFVGSYSLQSQQRSQEKYISSQEVTHFNLQVSIKETKCNVSFCCIIFIFLQQKKANFYLDLIVLNAFVFI